MPTLIRLTLAVALSASTAAALTPTDSARIARIFPFEVGQQYQFKAGGDFERPNDDVLPAGQVAEITITDTVIEGKTWLRIPYWSPFGRELYALDDTGRVVQFIPETGATYVLVDPRPDTLTFSGMPFDLRQYSDVAGGFCFKMYCEPSLHWQWASFAGYSGCLIFLTSGYSYPDRTWGVFAHHGGLAPGSSLHGLAHLVYPDRVLHGSDWGLFRPKSSDPWPEFERPVQIGNEPDGEVTARPERPRIFAAPNPFNPSTTIRYTVDHPGLVTISVFDLTGRYVRSLVSRHHLSAGWYTVRWGGTDDAGRAAASGVYVVRLEHAPAPRHGGVRTANSLTNASSASVRRVTLIR